MPSHFELKCSTEVFSQEEIDILERFGEQFLQLMHGKRPPQTDAQRRFIAVAHGECRPDTVYEKVWRKYLDRMIWERENKAIMGERPRMPNDREEWKRMRGAVWSEVRRRSRGLDA